MSETKSQSADDGQVDNQTDDDERELLQLTDVEVHAFELGVKEIIRAVAPTELDSEAFAGCNPQQDKLDDVDEDDRTNGGFFVYSPSDVNDMFAAVAESPLIECVDFTTSHRGSYNKQFATLVHTEYVDEYVEWNEQEDDQ